MTRLKHVFLVLIIVCPISIFWSVFPASVDTRSPVLKGERISDKHLTQRWNDDTNVQLHGTEVQSHPCTNIENDIAVRFEKRKETIKDRCKRFNGTSIIRHELQYLKDQKILYCSIAKIASTFWKKILYTISHPSRSGDSFGVNPLTAYSNLAFTKIIKESDIPGIMNDSEYISYHSKRLIAGKYINAHFSPSIDHCNVCMMDFKYIGKYETLEEDAKYIVKKFKLRDEIDIMTNFTEKSVVTLIREQAGYMFAHKKRWESCISFQCALYRVWKRLICRGVISKDIPFPYTNQEKANAVTRDEFFAIAIEAHERSNPVEIANNRKEVLTEAYRSLDKTTLHQMIEAYKDDFDLFDYSRKPDFLTRGEGMISTSAYHNDRFSYLQDCPY